jgi:hypothetical protein
MRSSMNHYHSRNIMESSNSSIPSQPINPSLLQVIPVSSTECSRDMVLVWFEHKHL